MPRILFAATMIVLLLVTGCGQRSAQAMRRVGDDFLETRNYDRALIEYEQIIDRYPGDWDAQYKVGLCCLQTQRPNDARRALEIAHTLRPGDHRITDALCDAMYQQGDEPRLFTFVKTQAETSQDPADWLRFANYARLMGDPDSARTAIGTAIELDGGVSVDPYLHAAALAMQVGERDVAVRRLRQAYGINPYDERVRTRLRELGEIPGPSIALPPGR
ncbi:MAG: tetratricopeptide repeat protein [Phycisphaerales bacterium]|nr:tetratricopeptide repeat protein [Phycisphaerales bacterium]